MILNIFSKIDFENDIVHYQPFRSSHRRCPIQKVVFENFVKFTGKHLRQSLFFNKLAGWGSETLPQVFFCVFCEIFKNTFSLEYLQWLLLTFLWSLATYVLQVFPITFSLHLQFPWLLQESFTEPPISQSHAKWNKVYVLSNFSKWEGESEYQISVKFSMKNCFSKCDQIPRKLRIWSHLLKKSLMENFIFYAVLFTCHSKLKWGSNFTL